MTRVAHVVTDLTTGGAEMMLLRIATAFQRSGSPQLVISVRGRGTIGDRLVGAGVELVTLECTTVGRIIPAIREARARVAAFAPDIVQGWMYHGNLFALMAGGGRPVAWGIRQSLSDLGRERPLTRWVIRANRLLSGRPEAVIYNSEASRLQHEAFGFAAARGSILPNGFPVERFDPTPAGRAAARGRLGLPMDVPVVGGVARFHPMKDHATFLAAMAGVTAVHPRLQVVLAGRGVSKENPEFASLLAASGLGDRVHCLGDVADVAALYPAFDLLCMSSRWGEAFPNVVAEAMASGVPCVVTPIGEAAAIVGETGVVVPPASPERMAEAVGQLLAAPEAARQERRAAARARIVERYSMETVLATYRRRYAEIIAGARAGSTLGEVA